MVVATVSLYDITPTEADWGGKITELDSTGESVTAVGLGKSGAGIEAGADAGAAEGIETAVADDGDTVTTGVPAGDGDG